MEKDDDLRAENEHHKQLYKSLLKEYEDALYQLSELRLYIDKLRFGANIDLHKYFTIRYHNHHGDAKPSPVNATQCTVTDHHGDGSSAAKAKDKASSEQLRNLSQRLSKLHEKTCQSAVNLDDVARELEEIYHLHQTLANNITSDIDDATKQDELIKLAQQLKNYHVLLENKINLLQRKINSATSIDMNLNSKTQDSLCIPSTSPSMTNTIEELDNNPDHNGGINQCYNGNDKLLLPTNAKLTQTYPANEIIKRMRQRSENLIETAVSSNYERNSTVCNLLPDKSYCMSSPLADDDDIHKPIYTQTQTSAKPFTSVMNSSYLHYPLISSGTPCTATQMQIPSMSQNSQVTNTTSTTDINKSHTTTVQTNDLVCYCAKCHHSSESKTNNYEPNSDTTETKTVNKTTCKCKKSNSKKPFGDLSYIDTSCITTESIMSPPLTDIDEIHNDFYNGQIDGKEVNNDTDSHSLPPCFCKKPKKFDTKSKHVVDKDPTRCIVEPLNKTSMKKSSKSIQKKAIAKAINPSTHLSDTDSEPTKSSTETQSIIYHRCNKGVNVKPTQRNKLTQTNELCHGEQNYENSLSRSLSVESFELSDEVFHLTSESDTSIRQECCYCRNNREILHYKDQNPNKDIISSQYDIKANRKDKQRQDRGCSKHDLSSLHDDKSTSQLSMCNHPSDSVIELTNKQTPLCHTSVEHTNSTSILEPFSEQISLPHSHTQMPTPPTLRRIPIPPPSRQTPPHSHTPTTATPPPLRRIPVPPPSRQIPPHSHTPIPVTAPPPLRQMHSHTPIPAPPPSKQGHPIPVTTPPPLRPIPPHRSEVLPHSPNTILSNGVKFWNCHKKDNVRLGTAIELAEKIKASSKRLNIKLKSITHQQHQ